MKKIYALTAFVCMSGSLFAQLPVSQTASNKKAVLEEFTGITCVFCPDGHQIANTIAAANPGDFFPVNIHTGGFASPQGPGTDFRTADGNAIAAQPGMGITGYPQGAMNRRTWNGSSSMAHSRGDWAANSTTVMGETSYVNVAGEATLDVVTRVLTIDMEAYYTAAGPASNNYTVMLLQDNVSGPQTGAANFNPSYINPDGSYRHMHMLRDVINPTALGDPMGSATTMGTTWTNQLTYTVPADYTGVAAELADLHLIIFISEGNTNIVTAAAIPITFTGFTTANNASLNNLQPIPETCKTSIEPSFKLKNEGSATMTSATISYTVNGGTPSTYNWTGSLTPLQSEVVNLPAITYTLAASNTLAVTISDVNGGTDEDVTNNAGTQMFNETTAAGNTVNLYLDFVQDRYGSESTWTVYDDNGTAVANGGPYTDLAANGTQLHAESFVVPASGCYSVEVLDSYGDGINAGYGNGSIELRDGTNGVIWASNGVFASEIGQEYKVTSSNNTTGLEGLTSEGFSIYPNPATDNVTVEFEAQNGTYEISIVDLTGRVMTATSLTNVSGAQEVVLPISELASGNYLVNIVKNGVKFTEKIIVQ